MTTTYVFIRPQTKTDAGLGRQQNVIQRFIRPAIKQAKLNALADGENSFVVETLSLDLISSVYTADMVLVDANCYEESEAFNLSPYLYYLVALSHSLGNKTFLMAEKGTNLPHCLLGHTLFYSQSDPWPFLERFQTEAQKIQNGNLRVSDNPIQDYLVQIHAHQLEQQLAQAQAALAKKDAEMKADQEKVWQNAGKITFRAVPQP